MLAGNISTSGFLAVCLRGVIFHCDAHTCEYKRSQHSMWTGLVGQWGNVGRHWNRIGVLSREFPPKPRVSLTRTASFAAVISGLVLATIADDVTSGRAALGALLFFQLPRTWRTAHSITQPRGLKGNVPLPHTHTHTPEEHDHACGN